MPQEAKPAKYFAETAIGAVVLVAIQFLSLPVLVGGLALIGIAKLVSSLRAAKASK
jgi:cell division septation protein DedD